jgi:C4-dicarboxylate-specific signal transduction histidine kinase
MDLPTRPVVVTGDRVHLQQVLLNLLLNAMDAMGDTSIEHRRLMVTTATTNGHVDVSVEDGGSGIPPGTVNQIFQPFFTTKPDGMGMGLAIAQSIIQAHHGRLSAENNVERGATVRFSLPLRRVDNDEPRGSHAG